MKVGFLLSPGKFFGSVPLVSPTAMYSQSSIPRRALTSQWDEAQPPRRQTAADPLPFAGQFPSAEVVGLHLTYTRLTRLNEQTRGHSITRKENQGCPICSVHH